MIDPSLPPNDIEAEKALIGSMLIDPEIIPQVSAKVQPSDFYLIQNSWLFDALCKAGSSADMLTMSTRMEQENLFDQIGGDAYLAEVTSMVPTALAWSNYADTVAEHAVRRSAINACSKVAALAWDLKRPVADVIASSQSVMSASLRSRNASKGVSKSEALEKFMSDFDELVEKGVLPGIPSTIHDLDFKIGGWKPGKMYVIAGKPGIGKTTFMLNMLLNAARQGYRSALYSCEMTEQEIAEVCIANIAGTSYADTNLSPGAVVYRTKEERQKLRDAVAWARWELEQLPIEFFCIPGMTPAQFVFEAKTLKATKGLHIAGVDYIQLMTPSARNKDNNRERDISGISEELKQAAMDTDLRIPILAGSQVNEAGEMRESRSIEANADTVIVMTAENPPILDLNIKKNRGGSVGEMELYYRRETATIKSNKD